MKKALMVVSILLVAVISTACINNIAVQELNNKALEYIQKGDYESAISRLEASLDLDATTYQTYYNLGVASINANKFEKAINALENGIKINPEYNDFYYSLGVPQISLADEIMDESEENVSSDLKNDDDALKQEKTISQDDKDKAFELKRASIENLKKYLSAEPDAKDKESIEEMIRQSEEFLSGGINNKVEKE